jgi:hypothetical protein
MRRVPALRPPCSHRRRDQPMCWKGDFLRLLGSGSVREGRPNWPLRRPLGTLADRDFRNSRPSSTRSDRQTLPACRQRRHLR